MDFSRTAAERWFEDDEFKFSLSVVEECRSAQPTGTLLFLHGRLGHRGLWAKLFDEIGTQFRCLAVDLPGFGTAARPVTHFPTFRETSRLIEKTVRFYSESIQNPEERLVVVGHDHGGAFAQLCELQCPEAIDGVILLNSTCLTRPIRRISRDWTNAGWLARWRLNRAFKAAGVGKALTKATLRALRRLEASWPTPDEQETWREELARSRRPILMLQGGLDPWNGPEECGAELIRDFAESEPEPVFFEEPTLGHFPFVDDPEWVARKIREFLFRLPCGRKGGHETHQGPRHPDQKPEKDRSPAA